MSESVTTSGNRALEIVESARTLFLENGYAGTSMAKVAMNVGIRKASLYHHFASKDELFIACVVENFEDSVSEMRALRANTDIDDEQRLQRVFDIVYQSIVESPIGQMSPIIAETSRSIPEVARQFFDNYISKIQEAVGGILEDSASRGVFRPMEPRAIELMIFAPIVHTSLSLQMFGYFDDLAEHYDPQLTKAVHYDQVLRLLKN